MTSNRFPPEFTQTPPDGTFQPRGWGDNTPLGSQEVSVSQPLEFPWRQASPIEQPVTSPPSIKDRSSPNYRQNRIDRAGMLLKERYWRIVNETNSNLLCDKQTGEVLPEVVDAIERPIATLYRVRHNAEVSKGEIKRALDYFCEAIEPTLSPVFFGRAGYNVQQGQRFVDAGQGECLVFFPNSSNYSKGFLLPLVRPLRSRPFPNPANVGYVQVSSITQLFQRSVLSRDTDLLLIAWMVLCWMPDRKQVMLELLGAPSSSLEQAHFLVRHLVDPASEPWQNDVPKHVKQFDGMALRFYLLSFNQVDTLTDTQQQHLFSLMRGKQVQWQWNDKKLNVEIAVKCPVMLSSLESVVTQSKLADVTISIEVEEEQRQEIGREEVPFLQSILAESLVTIFGRVGANWATVEHENRFQHYGGLADFCRVGELVAQVLGRDPADFWAQFGSNQQSRREFEFEASPVAMAIQKLLEEEEAGFIELSVKEWLSRLEAYRPETLEPDLWPTSSHKLGADFKAISPLLRDLGINLSSMGRRGPLRYWRAEKVSEPETLEDASVFEGSGAGMEPERSETTRGDSGRSKTLEGLRGSRLRRLGRS